MVRFAIALLLLLAAGPDKPHLEVRAFPKMQTLDLAHGCSSVLLTAEIKGPETESWYCPAVEWRLPDGTRASEESDCPPFRDREEYPRVWRRRVCAPASPDGYSWVVEVRLSRAGHEIARDTVEFWVK